MVCRGCVDVADETALYVNCTEIMFSPFIAVSDERMDARLPREIFEL